MVTLLAEVAPATGDLTRVVEVGDWITV